MRGLIGLTSLCLVGGVALPAPAERPLERGRDLVTVLWSTSNITPDPETSLGRAQEGEIIAVLDGGRRAGGRVLPRVPAPEPPKKP